MNSYFPKILHIGLLYLWCCVAAAQSVNERRQLPMQELKALASAYAVLQESFVQTTDGRNLIVSAIRGMVHDIDPDGGEYFTEEEFNAFKEGSPANWGSVGLETRSRNGELILAPIVGGPADVAGLRPGDRLWSIDGKPVANAGVSLLFQKLSGPIGTKVVLGVIRNGAPFTEVAVERKRFELQSPTMSRPQSDIAMLVVHPFRGGTLEDATALLRREWKARPYRALIVDLRGNPGGLLEASLGIASIFLPSDALLAKTSGNGSSANQEYRAVKAHYTPRGARRDPIEGVPTELKTIPIAVLIDEGTASGAEIVAAALRDHNRATLVGRKTFGRGSIQTLTPLPGAGAIKYTSAYWTTPSGARIQDVGISPHVSVQERDPQRTVDEAMKLLATSK
jgi:carboxyl-terminal processing protease